jgi:hypothetical protein
MMGRTLLRKEVNTAVLAVRLTRKPFCSPTSKGSQQICANQVLATSIQEDTAIKSSLPFRKFST